MAIRNVVTDGVGVNNGVIGWIMTQGIGNFSAGGGGGGLTGALLWLFNRRRRAGGRR